MAAAWAIVALAATGGCGAGADDPAAPATAPTTARQRVDADTSWPAAVLSVDGLRLEIAIGSQPEGDGPCEQRFLHEVIEEANSVTVAFEEVASPSIESQPCALALQQQIVELELDGPLGDRELIDGSDGARRPVWRRADLVVPEVLPEGVADDDLEVTPSFDQGTQAWTMLAQVDSGPGWDLWIDQLPAGTFTPPSTAPGAVVDTVAIGGDEATIYEYFNHTGHLIRWSEDGLDLTIRAELHTIDMDDPQSFANPSVAFIDDELVAIAEGLRVP